MDFDSSYLLCICLLRHKVKKKARFIFPVPLNDRKHPSNRSTDREALYFSSRRDQGIWILKAAFRALMNIDIEQQRKTQQPKWSSCREPLEALTLFPGYSYKPNLCNRLLYI